MNILEISNLNKKYKDFELKNINLTIPAGFIFGFVGQNGAGKTSTINLINHICNFKQGTIRINGKTYEEDPVAYKESIAYIGDECYFPQKIKINSLKNTLADFYHTFDKEKFDSLVKKYNLPTNKKTEDFSRGMKVKLMFASVFARDSKLMILDEATNGLDPVVRDELLADLQEYIESGERSILFSTHVLSDLEEIADYIAFIDRGEIVLDKPKDEMLEDYMVIKGDYSQIREEDKKYLIGLEKKKYGFEAIIKSENVNKVGTGFTFDKPEISEIMLHCIKDRRDK